MVLGAEKCTAMQVSPSNEELTTIYVVPRGEYEDIVLCFSCDGRFWYPKSHEWYGSLWDSMLMLMQMQFPTNKEALKLLDEMDAFDCPCKGFDDE